MSLSVVVPPMLANASTFGTLSSRPSITGAMPVMLL
jgi:hypothetical protein